MVVSVNNHISIAPWGPDFRCANYRHYR